MSPNQKVAAETAVDNPIASAVFDMAWMAPGYRATASEALPRIRALCQMHDDLFPAVFVVLASNPGVPRDILAGALRQIRPELQAFSRADVVGMLVAAYNGGRQGFEAVLRTRRQTPGPKVVNTALPWASEE
jgi:hypothetical protein